MAHSWVERPPLVPLLLVGYLSLSFYSLWHASLPSIACRPSKEQECLYNSVAPGDRLGLELLLLVPVGANASDMRPRWTRVETCRFNITLPSSGWLPVEVPETGENCTFVLPETARVRWSTDEGSKRRNQGVLRGKFSFRQLSDEGSSVGPIVAEVPVLLTRILERSSASFWKLDGGRTSNNDINNNNNKARKLLENPVERSDKQSEKSMHIYIPHLKYGSQPVVIRYVADEAPYGGPRYVRGDGVHLEVAPWNRSLYRPIMYVDENALQHSSQREIAPPEEGATKPPVLLRIQISTVSPIRDVINRQISIALEMAEAILSGSELDEFRYWLRDERLYRFFLTQVISFVHVWVDYLAFRDEVRFYRGKTDFKGVSFSSVSTRLLCSVIIFLYLLDGGGTSWVVLLSVFSGVAVDAWKAWKLLRPIVKPSFPFVSFRPGTAFEQTTAQYDRIAVFFLSMFLYPVVVGWSIYALKNYEYTSWYSWLISNLANAVYTFGFIALCPQLYVNYRLKSVAHLPWKVFLYKVFNTFVDDVFAFLIDMPWKHRIMTLRDDVVFGLFLVQAYIYRVDKTRTNEYGYSYEHEDDPSDKQKEIIDSVKDKDA